MLILIFSRKKKLIQHSLSDIQKNLVRGTQIISTKDIAWIIHNLDFKSGDTIEAEAVQVHYYGSGSGSIS